jgi:Holliday junction resolvasome RuvABC endonuclease subunit
MSKFHIEDLKQEASMINWTLLSDTYTNLDTELSYKCPKGHEVSLTYRYWRENQICPICSASMYQPVDKVVPKHKGKKRIIALDDATHDTGWAIFDGDTLIKYGVFSTNQSTEVERISAVKQWLINLITVWAPDTIVIEDIQLQKEDFNGDAVQNLTTYKVLAHLQGVLQNILFELHIPFETVYSAVWRKACEIKGRYRADKKRSAQLQVKKWYGLDVSNDEADAICIGRYYLKKTTPRIIKWE